jgi:hypothetical protein
MAALRKGGRQRLLTVELKTRHELSFERAGAYQHLFL